MRLGANVSLLYPDRPLTQRIAAARADGFDAVEILFPYAEDVRALRDALRAAEMPLALINTPAGDWAAGERGFAAVPGAEARFREGFGAALTWARALGAEVVHVMAGLAEGRAARTTFVDNLRWAVAEAGAQRLTIEPINADDMPGYFLGDFALACDLLDEVGAPTLGLQFDAYHAARITGDVAGTWAEVGHRVFHVQVAGVEDRHEPDDQGAFLDLLEAQGFMGVVSGEYHPRGRTGDGLGWMDR
ncbi:TIM barrel protein [Roseovarius sp. SCSIO 43702]|nr:TIM barrel protein [Roseovarius sp. SCSIO 43702]